MGAQAASDCDADTHPEVSIGARAAPEFDFHCPVMSSRMSLRPRSRRCPHQIVIEADPAKVACGKGSLCDVAVGPAWSRSRGP